MPLCSKHSPAAIVGWRLRSKDTNNSQTDIKQTAHFNLFCAIISQLHRSLKEKKILAHVVVESASAHFAASALSVEPPDTRQARPTQPTRNSPSIEYAHSCLSHPTCLQSTTYTSKPSIVTIQLHSVRAILHHRLQDRLPWVSSGKR